MGDMQSPLAYLLMLWGAVTVVLVILVVYRGTLSSREDDQLFLNEAEEQMMGSDQRVIVEKMNRLWTPIVTLAVLSGVLLAASAVMWLRLALKSF